VRPLRRGEGTGGQLRNGPMQKPIAYAPEPALRSADVTREPVPVASDERALSDAQRTIEGRTEG